jgi:DNA-binding MarR family transcriptional regulator
MPTIEEEIKQAQFRNEYHRLMVNMLYTVNHLTAAQGQIFREYDITQQQFNVLRILRGQHPLPASVNLIKERMLDKMSDVSRIVERLRQADYVERTPCSQDRRSVDICITQKGLDVLAALDKHDPEFDAAVGRNLSQSEAQLLNDLLNKMRG